MTAQTLDRSDRSGDGARLPKLGAAQPEVSVLRITVPAGVTLKRRLRVESDAGATVLLEPGQG